jgi:glycosyltransferase involved in cell wall biosynthesis
VLSNAAVHTPRISVVTACFNSAAHLEETMSSVLAQDYPDIEYIIVDGGSADGTVDIIRAAAERNACIRWISEPDRGIADAFNKGIREAAGDLIGILNSDDSYTPGVLQHVADAYARHPECDVFHGNMVRFEGDTPLFELRPADVERNIWHEMPLNHPATFVTRRAYQAVGLFDTGLKIAMDYDMLLRLHRAGMKFMHIDRVLAHMRYGGASDERIFEGLREIREISVRQGYPRWKANCWTLHHGFLRVCKTMLRGLGFYSLMRLHPKFKAYRSPWQ